MSNYHFNDIEEKWQKYWADNNTFKAYNPNDSSPTGGGQEGAEKPKYYVLDMFPYPSGAGLHVGHPLGYIASDVYARYKRHKGFNVLHPMGYDSFGLPAEQFAIQTGQHPAQTTQVNIEGGTDKQGTKIAGYRKQLDQIGFSFDWSREVRTSDPSYYKWTQWIFIQLFESWYDNTANKARPVSELVALFSAEGNTKVNAVCDDDSTEFSAESWNAYSETQQQEILLKYRLTYLAETEVNWCPALGTVLANDEVVNGVSERGGHPVIRKKMKQWSMRINAYAQRLLDGLDTIDWPQPLKDSQTNWIGRSEGATVEFKVLPLAPSGGVGSRVNRLTGNSHIVGTLLERAKEMRKNPTKAENVLWQELRNKKSELKFRRQHPIHNYIVDFVCLEKRLIIEVDGEIHQHQLDKDAERELLLKEKKGFKILRFTNDEVINETEKVMSAIADVLKVLPSGEDLGGDFTIPVFTTRPDTIFGVSFMTLAPEHELVEEITTAEQKADIEAYKTATAKRSERERMADVKTISGAFTGAYAEHPFTKEPIPIWIGDYVLAGYGTGAVMSVPCGDQRDYDFAKHFDIDIPNIFEGVDISEEAYSDKDNTKIANSDFLNGLNYKKATKTAIYELEKLGAGTGKINYRLRDAVFSRQRYWGEPFPVYYKNGMPQMIDTKHLPIHLPEISEYLPTEDGQPPLGRAENWAWNTKTNKVVSKEHLSPSGGDREGDNGIYPLELNTMPGWAGSSTYMFRYMDPNNDEALASKEAMQYWENVDLYLGGSEHATGHLLYSRFWVKALYDLGHLQVEEPFKKLINQGMILGESAFVHRVSYNASAWGENANEIMLDLIKKTDKFPPLFVKNSALGNDDLVKKYLLNNKLVDKIEANNLSFEYTPIHADVSVVNNSNELDIEAFKNWREEFKDAEFITEEDGTFKVSREVEKMSKSKYNVVSPDEICKNYGADTLRLYEMFLGPLEQAKPWSMAGITGVHNFLKKLWKLYHTGDNGAFTVSANEASKDSLKILHKTIKKVADDIENFSFNTSVSTFMIAVNELTAEKCTSREVLEPFLILISPYAPHIAEELWSKLGHSESISEAPFPIFDSTHLVESSKEYPISFNGKMRFTLELPLNLSKDEIESAVMAHEKTAYYLEGRTPKKVIVVPGKIVNIVG
ncbi:leucine--tRNA ligase [Rasiella sp. SM2506]|uniref:leucine--tRNA ligase n=1 Tax=Rasiella sp. SM2506 TaxID=3423914 RepID=UPI003D78E3E9